MEDKVYNGKICWFDPKKGIGFILWEKDGVKQTDIFVHWTDINVPGFKTIAKDTLVTFKIGKNHSNIDKAIEVTPIK